jgi:hypothetical protein
MQRLYKGLKKLLRGVIRCKDKDMKKRHLGKVFAWFQRRQEACDLVTKYDKDEEEIFLNPLKI